MGLPCPDPQGYALIKVLSVATDGVRSVAWSVQHLATAAGDSKVRVYDASQAWCGRAGKEKMGRK